MRVEDGADEGRARATKGLPVLFKRARPWAARLLHGDTGRQLIATSVSSWTHSFVPYPRYLQRMVPDTEGAAKYRGVPEFRMYMRTAVLVTPASKSVILKQRVALGAMEGDVVRVCGGGEWCRGMLRRAGTCARRGQRGPVLVTLRHSAGCDGGCLP